MHYIGLHASRAPLLTPPGYGLCGFVSMGHAHGSVYYQLEVGPEIFGVHQAYSTLYLSISVLKCLVDRFCTLA